MHVKNSGIKYGYNPITRYNDTKNTFMNFGILRLHPNESYTVDNPLEKAALLMHGSISFAWEDNSIIVSRKSLFDENPTVILTPSSISIEIKSIDIESEICIVETENETQFSSQLFSAGQCLTEQFGKGTLRETSTRDVRTVFDKNNMPESNLVLGEVINYPGKWSSYPPHGHNQPEIYHYRFLPKQGFGFSMDGLDTAYIVRNGDSLIALNGAVHSQTSAPGYAMYYVWAIRHLEGDPFGPKDARKFIPEHVWVMDPNNDSKIWPPNNNSKNLK